MNIRSSLRTRSVLQLSASIPLMVLMWRKNNSTERLVIELKDKVGLPTGGSSSAPGEPTPAAEPSAFQDAVASLMTLGYKPADADKLVRKATAASGADASVEELLRKALS